MKRYEKYVAKVKKEKMARDAIHSIRFWIIGGLVLIGGSATSYLTVKGSGVSVEGIPSRIVYGENIEAKAKATLNDAKVLYKKVGNYDWSEAVPTKVGEYQAKGVSNNGWGGQYSTKVYSFEIVKKEIAIDITASSVVYGDTPAYTSFSSSLVRGDSVSSIHGYFEQLNSQEMTAYVGLDTSEIKFTNSLGEDVTNCYRLTQELKKVNVTKRNITISYSSASYEYDGKAHSENNVSVVSGTLPFGDHIYSLSSTEITEIGSSINQGEVKVYSSENVDITAFYNITNSLAGRIEVAARKLYVSTPSLAKTYDGSRLSEDDLKYSLDRGSLLTGHRLVVDSYDLLGKYILTSPTQNKASFKVLDENDYDVTSLYDIIPSYGTVTISKLAVSYSTKTLSKVYDGNDLVDTNEYNELKAKLASTDRLEIYNRTVLSGVNETGVANTIQIGIFNEDLGIDVLNTCYSINASEGTLTVKKRTVEVVMPSYTGEYDGREHALDQITVTPGASEQNGKYDGLSANDNSMVSLEIVSGEAFKMKDATTVNLQQERENDYKINITDSVTGNDLSSYYNVQKYWSSSLIKKCEINYSTKNVSRIYDGFGFYKDQESANAAIVFENGKGTQGDDTFKAVGYNKTLTVEEQENDLGLKFYDGTRSVDGNYNAHITKKGAAKAGKVTLTVTPVSGLSKFYDGRGYQTTEADPKIIVQSNSSDEYGFTLKNAIVKAVGTGTNNDEFHATSSTLITLEVVPVTGKTIEVWKNNAKVSDGTIDEIIYRTAGLTIYPTIVTVSQNGGNSYTYDGEYHNGGNEAVAVSGLLPDYSEPEFENDTTSGWVKSDRVRYKVVTDLTNNTAYTFKGYRDVSSTFSNVLGTNLFVKIQYLKEGKLWADSGSAIDPVVTGDNKDLVIKYNNNTPSIVKRDLYIETSTITRNWNNETIGAAAKQIVFTGYNLCGKETITNDSLATAFSKVTASGSSRINVGNYSNSFASAQEKSDFIAALKVQRDSTTDVFNLTDNYNVHLSYGNILITKPTTHILLTNKKNAEYNGNPLGILKAGSTFTISENTKDDGAYFEQADRLPEPYCIDGTINASGTGITISVYGDKTDKANTLLTPDVSADGKKYTFDNFVVTLTGNLGYSFAKRTLTVNEEGGTYFYGDSIVQHRTVSGLAPEQEFATGVSFKDEVFFKYTENKTIKYEKYDSTKTSYDSFNPNTIQAGKSETYTFSESTVRVLQKKITAANFPSLSGKTLPDYSYLPSDVTTVTVDGVEYLDVTSYYVITNTSVTYTIIANRG